MAIIGIMMMMKPKIVGTVKISFLLPKCLFETLSNS